MTTAPRTVRTAPKVDVVITGHNYGHYAAEAIGSVLEQTRTPASITYVDDGSTDDTASVVRRFPGVTYCRTNDVGPAAARDYGIRRGEAPYVIFIDADDCLHARTVERYTSVLDRDPGVGFAFPDRQCFGESNTLHRERQNDLFTLTQTNFVGNAVCFRRAAYLGVGGFRDDNWGYGEDWELWLALVEAGWRWQHVPEPLALYRFHFADSLSFFTARFHRHYLALLRDHHPRLYPRAEVKAARRLLEEMPSRWNYRGPYRSVEDCRGGLTANPDNKHLLFLLAVAHLRNDQRKEARQVLRRLLKLYPEDHQARTLDIVIEKCAASTTAVAAALLVYQGRGLAVRLAPEVAQELMRLEGVLPFARPVLVGYHEQEISRLQSCDSDDQDLGSADLKDRGVVHRIYNSASRLQNRGRLDDSARRFAALRHALIRSRSPFHAEIGGTWFHLAEIARLKGDIRSERRALQACLRWVPAHNKGTERLVQLEAADRRRSGRGWAAVVGRPIRRVGVLAPAHAGAIIAAVIGRSGRRGVTRREALAGWRMTVSGERRAGRLPLDIMALQFDDDLAGGLGAAAAAWSRIRTGGVLIVLRGNNRRWTRADTTYERVVEALCGVAGDRAVGVRLGRHRGLRKVR